jgi:SAM-dependent methyltransferase
VSVAEAAASYKLEGLQFLVDDCETLANVHAPFDVICSFENIEHLQRPEKFVESAARTLKDDGVLLCSSPARELTDSDWVDGKPRNPYHINEWYRDDFHDLLATAFDEVEVRSQVVSLAYSLRKASLDNLSAHLTYLWSNPVSRLMRALAGRVGRDRTWPSIEHLVAASPEDYPIVTSPIADAVGTPWCHVAICRGPRR